jgi:hypothetical protein
MADFAIWVVAAEKEIARQVPWWKPGRFMQVYAENREGAVAGTLDASPLPAALRKLRFGTSAASGRKPWEGTPGGLLDALNECNEFAGERRPRGWPQDAVRLGTELRRIAPALRSVSWTVEFPKIHGRRIVRIAPPPMSGG